MKQNKLSKLAFLQSAKFRIVAALVVIIVVVITVFALWHHHRAEQAMTSRVSVEKTPGIQSVPGTGHPSSDYIKKQDYQNAVLAEKARRDITSSVPTITRQSFVGSPETLTQNLAALPAATKKQCAIKKVVYMYKPNPANCGLENLKLAHAAGVTAEELLCQACSCSALRVAGYGAGELKDVGYDAPQLKKCGYNLKQLIAAGFDAADLKAAGFSAKQLKAAGFTAGQLKAAGFSAQQLKAAGFNAKQLKDAGFDASQLRAAGFSPNELKQAGFTAKEIAAAMAASGHCSVAALRKAHKAHISAAVYKSCGLAALKAAGYTAAELKRAGFSAKALKDAGFSAAQLKAAGFSAKQLKDAGFSATQLKNAGFSIDALKKAGFTPAEIRQAIMASSTQCSVSALKKAREAGVSATELRAKGCGLAALKAAGFSAGELRNAGFSAAQLKAAGFNAAQLKAAGFNANQLKAAGFTAQQLKDAGFNAAQLKAAGFSAAELKAAGFTASQLKAAGFNAQQLKDAGFSAKALKDAGFSALDLKNAGFSAGALKAAGFSAGQLKAAGFDAKALREAGFSAADLKRAGFSAKQLQHAGFTRGDLLRAGFSPTAAGYAKQATEQNLKQRKAPPLARPVTPKATTDNNNLANNAGASMPSIQDNSPEARLRALQKLQQERLSQQQQRDAMQMMQSQMGVQAQKLMVAWGQYNNQTLQAGTEPAVAAATTGGGKGSGLSGPTFKAGTVMFAVLQTGVNTDEKSPIMATIVSGKLKGTKLLGSFQRVNKKVLLRFNLMNIPEFTKSISANLVAIDSNTANTAVSGYVNNHYLLKYGTLFASSFIDGFSQALMDSNSQVVCPAGGFWCMRSYGNFNFYDQALIGLGTVGRRVADKIDLSNIPPTVKIPGGTGIGVLFMSDLTLPQALSNHDVMLNP